MDTPRKQTTDEYPDGAGFHRNSTMEEEVNVDYPDSRKKSAQRGSCEISPENWSSTVAATSFNGLTTSGVESQAPGSRDVHDFVAADMEPLPPPILIDRSREPGAFPMPGFGGRGVTRPATRTENCSLEVPWFGESGSLVVANLVTDDELQSAIPHCNEAEDNERVRQDNSKQIRTYMLLAIILLVAIGMIAIAVSKSSKESSSAMTMPTTASSPPPASVEGSILSMFSQETILAITSDKGSPQSKAWQWMLEDTPLLSFLSDERVQQKFALATLFYATGGELWENSTNWLNHSIHECSWYNKPDFSMKEVVNQYYPGYLAGFLEPLPAGQCNEDGFYQHLWLDRNNLVGSLPPELYLLTALQTFSAAFNFLHGPISSHIGKLTALEGLVFSDLKDGGIIPSEIGLLTNFQVISSRNSNFRGTLPSEIWKLTNLFHFGLSANPQLKGTLPSEIGNCSKLRWLHTDDTSIGGTIPTEFGLLQDLDFASLFSSGLSGSLPSELGLLTRITLFSIFENDLIGTLPTELGAMTASTLLSFRGNQFTGTLPSEFGLLTELSISLNFDNNRFTGTVPTELGQASNLLELKLFDNQFTGAIPSELGHLSSVAHLSFANNYLTGSVPQEILALHPTLYTLTFSGNQMLSGSIPEEVCNINGTCRSTSKHTCEAFPGLSFDCTALLCGCDCSCQGTARNESQV
ncbi:Leucine Rich Repeat [Seminavis robusta]|uniref:Leucine Rich Repeat n=1 Tax=Seminavis robusta TaxID=568900 RepID=A0A9N8HSX2_9STRA|nr:Leucine Rich Repeat [Seminavis robusta]|eukprot:Sro1581_g283800.1 Leucine Rich Repeat (694) ;mRNA; f:13077-15238